MNTCGKAFHCVPLQGRVLTHRFQQRLGGFLRLSLNVTPPTTEDPEAAGVHLILPILYGRPWDGQDPLGLAEVEKLRSDQDPRQKVLHLRGDVDTVAGQE